MKLIHSSKAVYFSWIAQADFNPTDMDHGLPITYAQKQPSLQQLGTAKTSMLDFNRLIYHIQQYAV